MLRINLISWDNGVGLSRDLDLLGDVLAANGAQVSFTRRGRGTWRKLGRPIKVFAQTQWQAMRHAGRPRFDLNIMLEHVFPEYLPWARATAFIPNPEWCTPSDVAALDAVAVVLAKTQATERLFAARSTATAYIGFTSPDRIDRDIARQRTFFHLAGRSDNKGTQPLLALWRAHPEWPMLTVVQSPRTAKPGAAAANIRHRVDYVADGELRTLQNAHRFHLCPSETEGFGHYLVEAMSVGAVALTLDAAPMNELVQPDRGILVHASRSGMQNLATTYDFDDAAMAAAIEQLIGMSESEVESRGRAARTWYETNRAGFPQRLFDAVRRFASPR